MLDQPNSQTLGGRLGPLITQPREIFDHEAVETALAALADAQKDRGAQRLEAAKVLRDALKSGRETIEAAFWGSRAGGLMVARSYAFLIDNIVRTAFTFVVERQFPLANPTKAEQSAVAAVGGYGRGEMAPFSDVDLLFLTPYKQTAWGESVIEATLYLLWDLSLKVGHATRTPDDCLRLGAQDLTIRTSLLEKRFVAGSAELLAELDQRLWDKLFLKTGPDFVAAKLDERDARHRRNGGSRYLLEPNVKESKGGLRDLQTLFWIAKYLYRSDTVADLVGKGVFTTDEVARFHASENHLWSVRTGLHLLAGRAQEKLTFDAQLELAKRFGYQSRGGQREVERFMKRYFLAAKSVGDLTRIFCAALEEQHQKAPPLLGGIFRLFGGRPNQQTGLDWVTTTEGRLSVADPEALDRDPLNFLRLFDVAVRSGILLHPVTQRLIDQKRRSIDVLRGSPEAGRLFVSMLSESKDPGRALRRMSETGVLGRILPEFGRIIGQMQFNMYHHFTVDEHTIRAIENFSDLRRGLLRSDHPFVTQLAEDMQDVDILSVALLLHDIGKGLPGDHSVTGMEIAQEVCPQLGLSEAETEQVAWLVLWHLLMSDFAQKRDIADPATVKDFAEIVRSPARLKRLYVLTVCDIRAVGPGVWNGWKAQLLQELYEETLAVLADQATGRTQATRVDDAKQALRGQLADWSDEQWASHEARFFPTYWLGLSTETHAIHARLMAEPSRSPLQMRIDQNPEHDCTKVVFFMQDHPGLFARLAGAFALNGASVVGARVYTTKDGMAINTFWVQDNEGAAYDDLVRIERLQVEVERTLRGEVIAGDELRIRGKLKKRERSFTVAPSVTIDNTASDIFSVIEVEGRDRLGLLHDLAKTLANANVNIFSAIIATYGEQAVDVFYVKDNFGMKITGETKRAAIKDTLLTALRTGDETIDA
ncbi:MAG: [protein-PII] uridylyltransferase [Neomegalonema sp.]